MSYILDALKKSEQQRLAVGVPSLNSAQAVPIESSSKRRNWQLVAVVLLAVNAGAFGWWLASSPDLPASVRVPTPPAAVQPAAAPVPAAVSAPAAESAAPAAVAPEPVPIPPAAPPLSVQVTEVPPLSPPSPAALADRAAPPGQSAPRLRQDQTFAGRKLLPERANAPPIAREQPPAAERSKAVSPPVATAAPRNTPPAEQARQASEAAAAPTARSAIVAFGDLPASVRNALPPLEIGGYAEGPGGAAMIVVDDHLVREGDEVGPGVRVVKVSPDGAVFSYRNYRFRR